MIKTTNMILEELRSYANPKAKLSRMANQGECFRITRGLYETNKNTPGYLLAGSIYGPSYISFEYAMAYYNLIPEAVYTITCATFEKKKKKIFQTPFGNFSYRDVPSAAFPLGINMIQEGEYFYRIAEPEKALCDKLYTMSPVKNTEELAELLFQNLRIEKEELLKLDAKKIELLSNAYHASNVAKVAILLRRMQK